MNGTRQLGSRPALAFPQWGLFIILLAAVILGCTRTVVGGYVDSPSQSYKVYGRVYGAYGRSFLDSTEKTLRVSIVQNSSEKLLFKQEYGVHGGEIGWNATWDTDNRLTVSVFEKGGNSLNGNQSAPANLVMTLVFHLDPKRGWVQEKPVK